MRLVSATSPFLLDFFDLLALLTELGLTYDIFRPLFSAAIAMSTRRVLTIDHMLILPEKSTAKGRKTMVKLPWELFTPFSDFLRTIPNAQNTNREDDEEEDEDEMQAHQDSMQRLRVSSVPHILSTLLATA